MALKCVSTPRHIRIGNDTKSASETIQKVCPDITCQAIHNCVRLGSYTKGRNEPSLVQLNCSCNVLSILAHWHKFLQSLSLSNLTSHLMKNLLKQHCYTKGSYSLSQVQTKKVSEIVLIAFLSKRKIMI